MPEGAKRILSKGAGQILIWGNRAMPIVCYIRGMGVSPVRGRRVIATLVVGHTDREGAQSHQEQQELQGLPQMRDDKITKKLYATSTSPMGYI